MTIDRTALPEDPAVLSVHFASQDAAPSTTSTSAIDSIPSEDPTQRVETIDMKGRTSEEILEDFVRVTKAHPVEPTAEEKEELRSLEEQRVRSARDSALSKEVKARVDREKSLLEQARRGMEADAQAA